MSSVAVKRPRSMSAYMYKPASTKRFKPAVKATFPVYSKPRTTPASFERKFKDTALNFTVDLTGECPATGQLLTIAKGTAESERIGRQITVKKVQVRMTVAANTNTYVGGAFRILLVQDKQCNGSAATYSGVNGVLESDSFTAFRNLENSGRFVILKDWIETLQPAAGIVGAFNSAMKVLDFYYTCSMPVSYDSTADTGAIETIRSNNLFLLARSSFDDDLYQVSGVVRVRYID